MSKYSEHKKAAILSYVGTIVSILLGIFITPFIIRMLGDAQYGLYTLIGAFVGYLSILDLGLNNTIVRYVAQYRAQNDKKGEENFLAISFIIYLVIGLLILLVGMGFYLSSDLLFSNTLTPEELSQAKLMILILVANLAITIPGGAFVGICSGYEKFVFPRVLTIIRHITRAVMVIAILTMGSDALGLVILDSVLNVAFILITGIYVFRKLKISVKLHEYKSLYVKEIFSYSVWVFLFALMFQFQWRSGQLILGITTSTVTVAIFGIGVMLGVYYTTFGNIINRLLLPKAVQSVYKGASSSELTNQMIKIGRLTMVPLLYIFGAFLLIGQDFIQLWVGDTYKNSWLIALLIMLAYILPMAQGYAHSILEAQKKLRFKSLMFLAFCLAGIILGWYLSYMYQEIGMIVGLFSGMVLLQIVMNFYYQKKIELDIVLYFKKAIFPYVLPFIFIALIGCGINYLLETVSWSIFILKSMIYSIIYIIMIALFVLKKEERQIFLLLFVKKNN